MAQPLKESTIDQTTDHAGNMHDTPVATRPHEPSPEILPRTFGRYELRRLLGQGAMGAVYLAHDSQLDRLVALKIPQSPVQDQTAWRSRFLSKAPVRPPTLHHPNICPVFEVGEVGSKLYLTMAYIEGESLAARLQRGGSLPVVEAVELVRTIHRAMAEAHGAELFIVI